MLKKLSAVLASAWLLLFTAATMAQSGGQTPAYQDPAQPIRVRVDDLISRMTLKEKVGQLNMPCVYVEQLGRDIPAKLAACRRFAEGTYTDEIGPGGGFFTLADQTLHKGARQQADYFNELQSIAVKKTRLQIPLLQTEEGTHGGMFPGATIFPEGLGIGSSFDIDLVKSIYATAAAEARSVGIHQLCTLVLEPNRDPRMGRNAEGYSEDPYLVSRIAEAIVYGAQGKNLAAGDKVVTVFTDFPGQSEPASGLERGAVEASERRLREIFLPPWVAGITKAGGLGVMAGYPEVDGVVTHGSEKLLTKMLREELGFQGLVLSEGGGFSTLIYENIVATQKEAGALGLKAGVDLNITYEPAYMKPLIENVEEGRVSMALIDRAVRRMLTQKFKLGLFEKPYVDPQRGAKVIHAKEHQDLALRAARESIVLLKNDKNLLPLKKDLQSIAVIGPNADAMHSQLGDYTTQAILQHVVTVLEGIKGKVPQATQVEYAKGCEVIGGDKNGFAAATRAAKNAQIAVVVVGEHMGQLGHDEGEARTDGEGSDVANLDLTGYQEDLVKAVYETGTPTVVVLINGRPLSTRWTSEHVPAILEAWLPGERGGEAVADILFGDCNPSGRLAITVPRHSGQLPVCYDYKPSKVFWMARGYADMPGTPLYEFGYGLSYTKFTYSHLRITPGQIRSQGEVQVSVDVKNAGVREGDEVVQLYVHHVTGSVATPVKQLKGFKRISLSSGDAKTVTFTLTLEDLSLLNQDMHWIVEPGAIDILVGASSQDIRLKGSVEVVN
ncbi:MAG: glycoside hydrolase family 3 C-terminal domain-containing protein [Thermoguttaceae bacterium]